MLHAATCTNQVRHVVVHAAKPKPPPKAHHVLLAHALLVRFAHDMIGMSACVVNTKPALISPHVICFHGCQWACATTHHTCVHATVVHALCESPLCAILLLELRRCVFTLDHGRAHAVALHEGIHRRCMRFTVSALMRACTMALTALSRLLLLTVHACTTTLKCSHAHDCSTCCCVRTRQDSTVTGCMVA